ncbi:efflux transporter outer membrane subunit [Paludibacterium yongneupense]|uniref:efflux transporter outer membrane subunit n=1 Tax=Paludibacterium yongneupense TaxID=400061 RepID=UPI0003FF24B5|nr:efflux transporter outer membrane subunit [Paludibacterium yongneupense]
MKPCYLRAAVLLPSLLVLSACAHVFPPPALPADTAPIRYRGQAEASELGSVRVGAQRLTTGAEAGANWWQAYGSPELDALVAEGLQHSQTVEQARHQWLAARHALRASQGATDMPTVNASFSPVRQRSLNLPVFPEPTSLETIYTAELTASYTFDFFGQAFQTNRALASQVDQQAWQLQAARQGVVANIVTGAIQLASLSDRREILRRQLEVGRQLAGWTEARRSLGAVAQDPVLSARQQLAADEARLSALDMQLATTRHSLALLLGRSPDQAPPPLSLSQLRLPPELPLTLPSRLLQQRPDIRGAAAAVRAAADQAGAARAARFPSLTLSASMGRSGYNWSDLASPANLIWGMGASLTQPIFNGGALSERSEQAGELYRVSLAQYRQTVLSAFGNVADTLAALEDDARTVALLEQQDGQLQQLWRNSLARYRLGAASRDSCSSAEQSWLALRLQYSEAQAKRLSDSAALFNAMGAPLPE